MIKGIKSDTTKRPLKRRSRPALETIQGINLLHSKVNSMMDLHYTWSKSAGLLSKLVFEAPWIKGIGALVLFWVRAFFFVLSFCVLSLANEEAYCLETRVVE